MTKQGIQKLFDRYLNDECSSEEKECIDKWLDSLIEQEIKVGVDLNSKKVQLQEYIQLAMQSDPEFSKKGKLENTGRLIHFYWVAAALILISCGVLIYFVSSNLEKVQSLTSNVTEAFNNMKSTGIIENDLQEEKEISLADGSIILLAKGGKIEINPGFKGTTERIVHLEGKAFFKVAHDANRPFIVVTKNLVTKVLGTSFTIDAEKGQEVTVAVKTGKVVVYYRDQGKKIQVKPDSFVAITANHQIRFDATHKKLVKSIVEHPSLIPASERLVNNTSSLVLDSQTKRMKFDGVPAAQILKALEEAYGIKIKFDQSKISECIITATLTNDDLYTGLQTICNLIDGTYQTNRNEIEILSPGCR